MSWDRFDPAAEPDAGRDVDITGHPTEQLADWEQLALEPNVENTRPDGQGSFPLNATNMGLVEQAFRQFVKVMELEANLSRPGPERIRALKLLRSWTGLSLPSARRFFDGWYPPACPACGTCVGEVREVKP